MFRKLVHRNLLPDRRSELNHSRLGRYRLVPNRIAACYILQVDFAHFSDHARYLVVKHFAAVETERIITAVSKIRKSKDIGTSKTSRV